jgi:hypothetical protein
MSGICRYEIQEKASCLEATLGRGHSLRCEHRALVERQAALAVDDITQFMVWREGHRVRWFASPSDYVMKFAWSPDNHRLLVMSDGSGAADFGCGGIYCFKLQNPPRYKYVHLGYGCEMGWQSPRIALIWKRFEDYGQPNFGNLKPPVS